MLVEQCRTYFARSIELAREIASRVASGFRSSHASNDLDSLRDRLEIAQRCVARNERLVAGWREVIATQQGDGPRDLALARDLLKTFENDLEIAITSKGEAEKALDQRLLDIFEGIRGHLPKNDRELHDWLASAE